MKRKELTPRQKEHIDLCKWHINDYLDMLKKRNININELTLDEINMLIIQTESFLAHFHTLNELLKLKLKFNYDWKQKLHTKEIKVKINRITHSEVFTDNIDLIIAKANLFDEMLNKKYITSEIKSLDE